MVAWSFAYCPPRMARPCRRVLIALSHSTAGAVPSRGGFACVACGFKRSAEGKIMQGDVAKTVGRRKGFDNAIGPDMADQSACDARSQSAQRGRDAAAPGIPQQRRNAGGARHPDFYGLVDAAATQLSQPAQNAFRGE